MIDKNYCMSSFLAFRYIERDNVDFYPNTRHHTSKLPDVGTCVIVNSADEIDRYLTAQFKNYSKKKMGILLSGGMDSACLASYMPKGSSAYTFRFDGGNYAKEELNRAEKFAEINGLKLSYVDIDWNMVMDCLPYIMKCKGAPVHSIEPQIFISAKQAKNDDIELMVIGDAADYVFYGMDGLLAKDWTFDEFVRRSMYINPKDVLINPSDILYLYERYRRGDSIDYISFYDKSITEESYGSYENAFAAADLNYVDPYENFKMGKPLDLKRTRKGDSKYFIRELFKKKYPNVPLPEKSPMPRPVDLYFKDWKGPTRKEFRKDISIDQYTGNQRWLLWCLEKFLDINEPR